MDVTTIVLIAIIAGIVLFVWTTYNSLATGRVRIKEALSDIDVQLKRRIELIPNLIETVKGYVKHEKEVLENVTKARTSMMGAKTLQQKAGAENMMTDALKTLFAVAENYPQLKANENFKELQRELTDTEDKISYSRRFYNSTVRDYNTTLANFPSGPLGRMFGFSEVEFFEATDEERKSVKVQF